MTISWLQDMDIMSESGGAQLTDRAHFYEGIRRGHDLELITPQSQVNALPTPVVVSNASLFPLDLFQDLQRSGKPYIFFCHDYWPICKYRLYYPMADLCKSCYLKERWLPILAGARLIIWLSPLHRESWLWLYPELASVPYHLAPSPVNPGKFRDLGGERQGVVAVDSLADFKGKKHVLKWAAEHPQVRVAFVGPANGAVLPANCRVLGWVPYSEMNQVYNHYEALLHLPQSPSPFDRTTAEAYLAGCRIIGNPLIGALSYPWFTSREEVANHCRNSPREFWEAVEKVIQRLL